MGSHDQSRSTSLYIQCTSPQGVQGHVAWRVACHSTDLHIPRSEGPQVHAIYTVPVCVKGRKNNSAVWATSLWHVSRSHAMPPLAMPHGASGNQLYAAETQQPAPQSSPGYVARRGQAPQSVALQMSLFVSADVSTEANLLAAAPATVHQPPGCFPVTHQQCMWVSTTACDRRLHTAQHNRLAAACKCQMGCKGCAFTRSQTYL
jgi:hypothetical protein